MAADIDIAGRVGAIVGPMLAGMVIAAAGIARLFAFTAAIQAALAVFVLVRLRRAEPVAATDRALFGAHPPISHGTQAMIELQPAAKPEDALP